MIYWLIRPNEEPAVLDRPCTTEEAYVAALRYIEKEDQIQMKGG